MPHRLPALPGHAAWRCSPLRTAHPRSLMWSPSSDPSKENSTTRRLRIQTELAHRAFYVAMFEEAVTSSTRSKNGPGKHRRRGVHLRFVLKASRRK